MAGGGMVGGGGNPNPMHAIHLKLSQIGPQGPQDMSRNYEGFEFLPTI